MARPKKETAVDAVVIDESLIVSDELRAEWDKAGSSPAFVVGYEDKTAKLLSEVKRIEIFARYLDIKKATSIGNVHAVTVIVYELLTIHKGDRYLFEAEDVKIVLEHFGYKADFIVDNALEARREISSLAI